MNNEFYTSVLRYGNNILYRGYKDGKAVKRKIPFKPTLFMEGNDGSGWTNLEGNPVKPIQFDSMSEAKDFVSRYDGVSNFSVHGNTNYVAQFVQEQFPNTIEFDRELIQVLNIDIEVESDDGFPTPEQAAYPIISITVRQNDGVYWVWGLNSYTPKSDNVLFIQCDNEFDMMQKFLKYWETHTPDIITGWNTRFFDIPYLVNRSIKLIGDDTMAKRLSPWGLIRERKQTINGKQNQEYIIEGVEHLDYLEIYKKFTYNQQESYRLDHITYVELGKNKLSYEEHGNLYTLYKEDYEKFINYNIRDVELVNLLDEKLDLLSLVMTMAYKAGVNYSDTLGTTGIWDSIIYRMLNTKMIAVPPRVEKPKTAYSGGYVKEPQVGSHDWVTSFDLNSLYPNIIVQYNMSPETVMDGFYNDVSVERFLEGQCNIGGIGTAFSLAPSGVRFSHEKKGVVPIIIEQYYAERRVAEVATGATN
jgi:DNA polymerase elongation subunit (family B)